MKVYNHKDYKDLAAAVRAGMPMQEAERILEEQRKVGGRGEEKFWLELGAEITTIQLTKATKDKLEALKKGRETYEDVIVRLLG